MVIENILKEELLEINKKIVKRRRKLNELLKDPIIEGENGKITIDMFCLKEIQRRCTLPLDSILLPITFFIPSGVSEGYVMDEKDARVVGLFVDSISKRDGKFWIDKYKIKKLANKYRGCFQIIILP